MLDHWFVILVIWLCILFFLGDFIVTEIKPLTLSGRLFWWSVAALLAAICISPLILS